MPTCRSDARRWRQLAAALGGLTLAAAAQAAPRVLVTPGYEVQIERLCPEGEVTCDQVRYRGTSRRSGQSIELAGRSLHTTCADGVTPCRFVGYEFVNGDVRYLVTEAGELRVTRGEQVLVQQQGRWR